MKCPFRSPQSQTVHLGSAQCGTGNNVRRSNVSAILPLQYKRTQPEHRSIRALVSKIFWWCVTQDVNRISRKARVPSAASSQALRGTLVQMGTESLQGGKKPTVRALGSSTCGCTTRALTSRAMALPFTFVRVSNSAEHYQRSGHILTQTVGSGCHHHARTRWD